VALQVNSDSSKRGKSGMEEFLFTKGWKRNYCPIVVILGGVLVSCTHDHIILRSFKFPPLSKK
jgi:hypothetical protein